jgi:O-antigen ligase
MAKRKNKNRDNSGGNAQVKGEEKKVAAKPARPAKAVRTEKSAGPAKAKRQAKPAGSGLGSKSRIATAEERKRDYLVSMSHAPRLDERNDVHWLQLVPAAIFTAIVILIVRQYTFYRDTDQYYWSNDAPVQTGSSGPYNQIEFFSHYKVVLIEACILFIGLMIAYRLITQQFAVKRSVFYYPMLGYILFVFLSFAFSSDKDIAWEGWLDRFEGTAAILCYFVALFFIINSVNSERNAKWIIYPIAGSTVVLSLIGVSQATGHDFFRTVFGQKLLVPNDLLPNGRMAWDLIDEAAARGEQYLKFTFQRNEIYQTVYNINYVSFYLTLLIPLFALLFIFAKSWVQKLIWGVLLSLVVFNFFGSASSGGMLGIGVILILVILVLNKKLLRWWKSVAVIAAIVVVVGAGSSALAQNSGGTSWLSELTGAVNASISGWGQEDEDAEDGSAPGRGEGAQNVEVEGSGITPAAAQDAASAPAIAEVNEQGEAVALSDPQARIDYFITRGNSLVFSVDNSVATLTMTADGQISVADASGMQIAITQDETSGEVTLNDERFTNIFLTPAQDEEQNSLIVFNVRGDAQRQWPFMLTGADKSELVFRNDIGKNVDLVDVPHTECLYKNGGFGSGRGYIWSASLPLIKDTILLGHGADTYCVYFPHNDYVGKYNAGWNINMIVDKPHNMYIATAINTGLISLIALLALFGMYIVQSFRLYRRQQFTTFAEYAGAGIFFGITGFIVSGFVDDSTVSVMPLFYGLLGTGIALNMMLKRRRAAETDVEEAETA